jgi:hypothetical protein
MNTRLESIDAVNAITQKVRVRTRRGGATSPTWVDEPSEMGPYVWGREVRLSCEIAAAGGGITAVERAFDRAAQRAFFMDALVADPEAARRNFLELALALPDGAALVLADIADILKGTTDA